jgi:hypothetical protein
MDAARTSETSVDNHFTRQYIPEDKSELNTCRRENLKYHILSEVFTVSTITASHKSCKTRKINVQPAPCVSLYNDKMGPSEFVKVRKIACFKFQNGYLLFVIVLQIPLWGRTKVNLKQNSSVQSKDNFCFKLLRTFKDLQSAQSDINSPDVRETCENYNIAWEQPTRQSFENAVYSLNKSSCLFRRHSCHCYSVSVIKDVRATVVACVLSAEREQPLRLLLSRTAS